MYRAIKISFESTPSALVDAAKIDSPSELSILKHIKLPLSHKGILAGIMLSFLRVMGEFGASLMVSGNIQGYTRTVPIAIWESVMNNQMTVAYILTIFLVMLSFCLVLITNLLDSSKENDTTTKSFIKPLRIQRGTT